MRVYCYTCRRVRLVVGFERDNPALACGHLKIPVDTDVAIEHAIETTQARIARFLLEGMTRPEAHRAALRESAMECQKLREHRC